MCLVIGSLLWVHKVTIKGLSLHIVIRGGKRQSLTQYTKGVAGRFKLGSSLMTPGGAGESVQMFGDTAGKHVIHLIGCKM